MIEYPVGTSGQAIVLTDPVLAHFKCYRQISRRERESGGQLFAILEEKRIMVVEATGPRASDRRTRTTYVPDRTAERKEIATRHNAGLHYVGDWHTHPDGEPIPSAEDLKSMAECFGKSTHQLNGFILVIVGTAEPPGALNVSIHDGSAYYLLAPG